MPTFWHTANFALRKVWLPGFDPNLSVLLDSAQGPCLRQNTLPASMENTRASKHWLVQRRRTRLANIRQPKHIHQPNHTLIKPGMNPFQWSKAISMNLVISREWNECGSEQKAQCHHEILSITYSNNEQFQQHTSSNVISVNPVRSLPPRSLKVCMAKSFVVNEKKYSIGLAAKQVQIWQSDINHLLARLTIILPQCYSMFRYIPLGRLPTVSFCVDFLDPEKYKQSSRYTCLSFSDTDVICCLETKHNNVYTTTSHRERATFKGPLITLNLCCLSRTS